MSFVLAVEDSRPEFFVVLFIGLVVLAAVVIVTLNDRRKSRELEKVRRASDAARQAANEGNRMSESDRVMFEQHRQINDLHIRKLEAEVALLQAQVSARADDEDRLHASKEFHELSVEKTKLEIDSLRLHIAEQRKRMDDWGLGGGG